MAAPDREKELLCVRPGRILAEGSRFYKRKRGLQIGNDIGLRQQRLSREGRVYRCCCLLVRNVYTFFNRDRRLNERERDAHTNTNTNTGDSAVSGRERTCSETLMCLLYMALGTSSSLFFFVTTSKLFGRVISVHERHQSSGRTFLGRHFANRETRALTFARLTVERGFREIPKKAGRGRRMK